jgi:uncharacterized protein YndB with AHSA1/START domain
MPAKTLVVAISPGSPQPRRSTSTSFALLLHPGLYEAFVDESLRERWLPEGELRERTASRPRSARFDWGDGETRVNVTFTAKGETKSAAALEHERLADAEQAERMKAFWRDRVAALKEVLER